MTLIFEILTAALMLTGTFLMILTSVGLIRFPDVFCRMHAAGKAGTMGISLLILATVTCPWTSPEVWARGLLAVWFQLLTTPAATHLLSHACYVTQYPRVDRTAVDELRAIMPSSRPDAFGHE
ncbi:MAG: monovalent cation/H(+) antiporter subunit G [Phycisphaeraceae bacterium]|nr:monovalent cation/H(+) antiporter subunit G [Phycisphaeraceae bacterium]